MKRLVLYIGCVSLASSLAAAALIAPFIAVYAAIGLLFKDRADAIMFDAPAIGLWIAVSGTIGLYYGTSVYCEVDK